MRTGKEESVKPKRETDKEGRKSTVGEYIAVFVIGAALYPLIETAFRGHSHFSMVPVGGLCLCFIYKISCDRALPVLVRPLLSAVAVTAVELMAGLLLNVTLGMGVWDYSGQSFNVMGQICPLFSLAWLGLCFAALPFCLMFQRVFRDAKERT